MTEGELVLDARSLNGESPTWSASEQKLYWIDTEEPGLHRFDPASGRDERWRMPSEIGAFALTGDGRILAALRTGLLLIDLGRQTSELLAPPPYDPLRYRFNDGKCDAQGRFWIGTMFKPLDGSKPDAHTVATSLFVYDGRELRATDVLAVIGNGIAWSPDESTLYFSDSHIKVVRAYEFDCLHKRISGERDFARFETGVPDGAAVDVEGCYWVANYDGGRVVRLRADGKIERELRLPVSEPTMCAFGGVDMRDLYVTSACSGLSDNDKRDQPLAGGIFRYRAPAPGLPVPSFRARMR